ncbi:OmpA family protein [Marixanthomonas spongiae]|uniref:Flagellar motor protein MotB n=1 Tax=Marixanthomonas spongiae TaxID=2174845 RepID=A0A2U0I5F0_9FLAO|nr:OmpA family protein [Marixanthomonas spongiae]PVW16335.1 flagellar motor protein MotB [Marixanthomonas spongiae]
MKPISQKSIFFLVLFFTVSVSFSQRNEIKKANKDFDKFAYIDAREIYLKVIEDGYQSAEIFQKLGDTYYWNSDYDNAAKWYSRLVNEYPDQTEPEYYYRAAQSLKSLGKYKESDELMIQFAARGGNGMLIKNFENDPNYLKSIAKESREFVLEKVSINSNTSDFGPSFYGDKVVYAASKTNSEGTKVAEWNAQPFLDLYVADVDENGDLINAQPLPGDINTKYHESTPVFSKDGKTMYFTRNNYLDGKKGKDRNKTVRLKLYKATKSGDHFWTHVKELPFNSDNYSTAHPALSKDGKRLYFSSDMPGTVGMSDLWYVTIKENDTYGKPVNLGNSINTEARESFPFISEKNNLYFSTDGRAGLGGFDIYMTPLDSLGNPGPVKNLGEPANSNQDDFGFIIKESERIGYLTSNREGTRGSIDDEIYLFKEKCQITITGLVTDLETGELLPGATVTLLDSDNKEIKSVPADKNARYTLMADCGSKYAVRGAKKGYESNEKLVETPNETGSIDVPLQLKPLDCPPDDLGCRLNLQPIYFDFDRYNIRPDAEVELAKILAALREYPELEIHIESHTDSRGNDSYNEALSEKRAQSTLNWLVKKGIDRDRLSAKGYGEYRLVNECSNGVKCTEEQHQLNRRSMFIIQN